MVDPKILKEYGCTNERLKQIFTAQAAPTSPAAVSLDRINPPRMPKTDGEIRRRFEARIRSRLIDGIGIGLKTSRAFQAVDIAGDAKPIAPETIPLMLWACGKIKFESLRDRFKAAGVTQPAADTFFKKNDRQEIIGLNEARIAEIHIDIVKSYIRRRLAAMNSLWSNLWPLFKYEPRGTDDISQLRGDVLSQRVDIMSDDYNYRHLRGQCNRQMLLYGYSVAFPRCAWDVKHGWRLKQNNIGEGEGDKTESFIEREGVDFVTPHPSRIFCDQSSPMANLNTDTGPSYIGYWDIIRYGDIIAPDADYFNINEVFCSDGWIELANQFGDFFAYYFNPTVLAWPDMTGADPTLANDRQMQIGRYTSEAPDQSILVTNYFERINPKAEGIGEYNSDVWLRLSVAGDCTVIGAEFMPSLPAAYGGIDCNDNRFANQSMGMALLSYQDQATNIMTQMIQQIRAAMLQIIMLDSDSLPAEILEKLKKDGMNQNFWIDPQVFIYSMSKLKELGVTDPKNAFFIVQNQITNVVQAGLAQLGQLMNMADRLLILSPNELGQPNPREVSAREVNEVSTSVQSMYSFINEGPREQTATMKQIIYESLVTCGKQAIRVPVEKRYTRRVVEAAGFSVPSDVLKGIPSDDTLPYKGPLEGNLKDLMYDYYFDSRDGSERVSNSAGAGVMVNLLQVLLKMPGVPQKLGTKNILDVANLIIRESGAPWNFQFDLPVGQDDTVPADDEGQTKSQLAALGGQISTIEKLLVQALHLPPGVFQGGGQPAPGQGAPGGAPGQPAAGGQQPPGQGAPAELPAPGPGPQPPHPAPQHRAPPKPGAALLPPAPAPGQAAA